MNKDDACEIIQEYAKDNSAEYVEKDTYCGADLKKKGWNKQQNYLVVKYGNGDNVLSVKSGTYWTDIIYNAKDISSKDFAQAFLDNNSWIDGFGVETASVHHAQDTYGVFDSTSNTFTKVNSEDGWSVLIKDDKSIFIKKIKKVSF
jgi:hypothetical protein